MTKQEAIQLLALIKVAYPTAYRDMDQASKMATVNMWAGSFPDVPYPIMAQAFNHFRMASKFPPTVAEMVEELKQIHLHATECALVHKTMGDDEAVMRYRAIMSCTAKYKNNEHLGLQLSSLPMLEIGGNNDVQRFGASGNNLCIEDRVSVMDEP